MTLPPLAPARAELLIGRFAGRRVLVAGDLMLDRFIVGHVARISPEAPVPVVRFQREYSELGGAANVAHNIAALGGQPALVGVVGADPAGGILRERLVACAISIDGLVEDASRPTVEKTRIVTDRHQHVARIDREHDADSGDAVEREMVERLRRLGDGAEAVLVSDYLKGAITAGVMRALVALKGNRAAIIVDPKIPHLGLYAGATLVTPNNLEAEEATHTRIRNDDEARSAATAFRSRVGCGAVLITRGEHGMWLSSDESEGAIPAVARQVSDVTGAGDTVAATVALAMAAGATLHEAAVLANHAAGLVVARFGPATVTAGELLAAAAGVDGSAHIRAAR
jgi:D-beta-D-heptose 7-phosphate kinase/D-beta-D-heptose 1-phosphate adenosyltransferase